MPRSRLVFSVALPAVLALLAVHLQVRSFELGNEIERIRRRKRALLHENRVLAGELSVMTSPQAIAARLVDLGILLEDEQGRALAGWTRKKAGELAAAEQEDLRP